MSRLVGYIRVSTSEQADHGGGLDIQEAGIRAWAKTNKHEIIEVYRDEGVSGTLEQDDREGLADAMAAIKYNGAQGLVVADIMRLSRNQTVQEITLLQIWKMDGKVFAVDTGEILADDPDDPTRTLIRQIMGAISQFEAAMIARRLRKGRAHKAARGGYIGGTPPYGWQAQDKTLIEDEAEQEILARVREMRSEGLSYRVIADTLNAEGVAAKRGGIWHPLTVSRLTDD